MSLYVLAKSASIQPRTTLAKFGGDSIRFFNIPVSGDRYGYPPSAAAVKRERIISRSGGLDDDFALACLLQVEGL